MTAMSEFLLARLAEDQEAWDSLESFTWRPRWHQERLDGPARKLATPVNLKARLHADIEAKRTIIVEAVALLDSWKHAHEGTPEQAMWPDVCRRERHQARLRLETLALAYADHKDYPGPVVVGRSIA